MTRTFRASVRPIALIASTAALSVGLVACSPTPTAEPDAASASSTPAAPTEAHISEAAQDALAAHDLDGLNTRELIDTLDSLAIDDRPADFMASIQPNQLLLTTEDGSESSLPMPTDAFYVSLAPYVDSTHDCYFHSLTTCTGELQEEDIHVSVTDAQTGDAVVDEDMTTYANGFVGLWLPRDGEFNVTIDYDGKTATQQLSTSEDDDATCVTTMQLA
ncbi:CueP family metal-binding protein [Demequina globuliformis]|uniref:CueP family metal-binding protein n=1 Tax=Demequina globuliformis TaxID=676202 RepID=UPI000A94977F|nr:CueP family metal-binding protein [Demequina globuliformis]